MIRWSCKSALAVLLCLAATACSTQQEAVGEIAFYWWQQRLAPTPEQRDLLDRLGTRQLFVKAFDVHWRNGRAEPTALLEVGDTSRLPQRVPVVFLTNEVLLETADVSRLAERVADLLRRTLPPAGDRPELQIDCDWTATTRDRYFSFLKALRAGFPGVRLSVTLRLHQYRDRRLQGVPPADRVVLMAYNTGRLDDWEIHNSILDTGIVLTYVAGQPVYPLPVDLAVPVYDWAVVHRQDRLAYLINEPGGEELADTSRFRPTDSLRYSVRRGTYLNGLYLYTGDLIRREIVSRQAAARLTRLLVRELRPDYAYRVIHYHLGSRQVTESAAAWPAPAGGRGSPR